MKNPARLALIGSLSLLLLVVLLMTYFTVQEQERGIVTTWGKFDYVASPGIGFKVPFMQGISKIPVSIQSIEANKPINTYTIDNQEIDITYTIFYRTPVAEVENVFKNVPDQGANLAALAVDRIKVEVGKVNTNNFADQRGQLRDRIKAVLDKDAKALGVDVTDFQITNADYAKSFREAVATAAAAKAAVETREQEQRQAEINAKTAQIKALGEANQAREAAKGEADANLVKATANAQAIKLQGEAQALAIKAQSDALRASPDFVAYTQAARWDGKLPTTIYGSAPIPFLAGK